MEPKRSVPILRKTENESRFERQLRFSACLYCARMLHQPDDIISVAQAIALLRALNRQLLRNFSVCLRSSEP